LVFLVMVSVFGLRDAAGLAGLSLFGIRPTVSSESYEFVQTRLPLMALFKSMLQVNFWWGIFNLLPVPPLDGGQITQLFVKPRKLVHQIAIGTAVAAGLCGFVWRESFYTLLFFGYLAWQNYQSMKENRWG
jgi:Zn-dependent protease